MKRNSKKTTSRSAAVVVDQSDVIISATTLEDVVAEIANTEEVGAEIITIEAVDVTDDTSVIDALLESAEVSPVEQLEDVEVEELIAAVEAAAVIPDTEQPPEPPKLPKVVKAAKVATPITPVRNFSDVAAMDKAALTAQLVPPITAKKVIEKAENLIAAVESGKRLSRYTSIAVKALIANGTVSGNSLVNTFTAEGLGIGTARSQAQQMTSLFKLSGLATQLDSGSKELVLNDVNLAKELAGMSV